MQCPRRSEEGTRSLGCEGTNGCEPPGGCYELNESPEGAAAALDHSAISPAPSDMIILCVWEGSVQDRKSQGSPGCPGTISVDQAGLRFIEISLPLPSKCWD